MQQNRTHAIYAILILLLASLATTACAQPGGGPGGGQGQGRRGPPPEALDACQGKQADDQCSFTGRNDETITGVCFAPQGVDELACAPEGGPPGRGER
jgi:hypothetical protein